MVDRLGAGFLGPYGATWLDTPGLNRLASQSLLIEHALADSPELARVYRSFWTGRHALSPETPATALPAELSDAGWQTQLLTDDTALLEHPLATGFQRREALPRRERQAPASRVERTQLGRVFTAARERLPQLAPPFFLWVHAEGMQGAWDAPWELRAQFADEDDPSPPEFVQPPLRRLPENHDPDEVLGMVHAYAGQVAALDLCLESFLEEFLASEHAATTLLAFTSPRGYPLGEHRRVGDVDGALYGELLRVPLMLRFPDAAGAGFRAQAMAQPADLAATLAEWLQFPALPDIWGRSLLPFVADESWPRDRAVAVHGGERAMRTPAWFLRRPSADESAGETLHGELYVKPDDQWEVNEVSDRLPDVAEQLAAALESFEQAVAANDESQLAPLPEGVA